MVRHVLNLATLGRDTSFSDFHQASNWSPGHLSCLFWHHCSEWLWKHQTRSAQSTKPAYAGRSAGYSKFGEIEFSSLIFRRILHFQNHQVHQFPNLKRLDEVAVPEHPPGCHLVLGCRLAALVKMAGSVSYIGSFMDVSRIGSIQSGD